MLDLLVTNGSIVTPGGVFIGAVGAKGEKTVWMGTSTSETPQAKRLIDATGKYVFPGFIDPHVHAWDPGRGVRDDWYFASRAAAYGGITTIVEHPLSIPPVKDMPSFLQKLQAADQKSVVDFALWGAIVPGNLDQLADLHSAGCVAFKGFISYCNEDYPNITDSVLYDALTLSAKEKYLLAVHAENAEMVEAGERKMRSLGRKDPMAHLESRENIVELEAINRVIFFTEQTGGHMHIVHMTLAEGAELLKRAKLRGVNITLETCPQFLVTDCRLLEERAGFAKCTPPLRRPDNTEKLWKYIEDGTIDFVASDHTDYQYEEKLAAKEDIWNCENGFPGAATLAPLVLDGCMSKRGIAPGRVAELLSTNAAKLFGLYPRKGVIAPGADADYAVVDMEKEWVIDGKKLGYKQGWSPYDGFRIKGYIDKTIVRGHVIYEENEVKVERGFGRFVNPRQL